MNLNFPRPIIADGPSWRAEARILQVTRAQIFMEGSAWTAAGETAALLTTTLLRMK